MLAAVDMKEIQAQAAQEVAGGAADDYFNKGQEIFEKMHGRAPSTQENMNIRQAAEQQAQADNKQAIRDRERDLLREKLGGRHTTVMPAAIPHGPRPELDPNLPVQGVGIDVPGAVGPWNISTLSPMQQATYQQGAMPGTIAPAAQFAPVASVAVPKTTVQRIYRGASAQEIEDFETAVKGRKTIDYQLGDKWAPEMQQFVDEAQAQVDAYREQMLADREPFDVTYQTTPIANTPAPLPVFQEPALVPTEEAETLPPTMSTAVSSPVEKKKTPVVGLLVLAGVAGFFLLKGKKR